jgi:hypothetical protein
LLCSIVCKISPSFCTASTLIPDIDALFEELQMLFVRHLAAPLLNSQCGRRTDGIQAWKRTRLAPLGLKARKRERVRCSSLVGWPVYPRLRRTMQASMDARNAGLTRAESAERTPVCGRLRGPRSPVLAFFCLTLGRPGS